MSRSRTEGRAQTDDRRFSLEFACVPDLRPLSATEVKDDNVKWGLQSTRRKSGRYYYEALQRSGRDRIRSVSLGYLTDDDVIRVRAVLDAAPAQLFAEPHHVVRHYVLGVDGEIVDSAISEIGERDSRRLEDAGKYEEMTLRDFYDRVWSPYRVHDHKATWEREDASRWPKILAHLGHVKVANLDRIRWDRFLRAMSTWGPTAKRLARNEYRLLLAYALGKDGVHECGGIDGSTKRARDPKPLSVQEVVAILDAATDPLHRALFALAFGQGTRGGEPGQQRWEGVDFEGGTVALAGTKNRRAGDTVPMAALTRRELKVWWISCGRPSSGWCFPWSKGRGHDPVYGKPIKDWGVALKKSARRVGGEALSRRVYPNLARHTFATTAALSGVPKAAAKTMMRHETRSEILEAAYQVPDHAEVGRIMDATMPRYDGKDLVSGSRKVSRKARSKRIVPSK